MSGIRNLRLEVILSAIDKATRPIKAVTKSSSTLAKQLNETKQQLNEVSRSQALIDKFRDVSKGAAVTAHQLGSAQERVKELKLAMQATLTPSKELTRAFEEAKREAGGLKLRHGQLIEKQQRLRDSLKQAGIETRKLSDAQSALKSQANALTNSLDAQKQKLEQVNKRMQQIHAARGRYEKAMARRNGMASTGATMMVAGAATGATMAVPIRAYAQAEDAATQLRVSMMEKGGKVKAEYAAIAALAERLGNRLPGTTAEFQQMMTMLNRQGMSAKAILGGLGEATAYLGVQLKMAPEAAAEFTAKLQDATRTSEKDMMGLVDMIQRGFYAGVDADNMLEAYKGLGAAMDMVRVKGLAGAQAFAPFVVMMDQAGMRGESAGNAIRKVITASLGIDKIKKVQDSLAKEKGIKLDLDFTDGKGEFKSIDNLMTQLNKLQGLNTVNRLAVLKDIFGDDKETNEVLSKIIDKGKAGYDEVVHKLATQASLQERVNAQLGTLKNLWDAASGTFTNALVRFGEAISPELKTLTEWLAKASEGLGNWAKENPGLANTLMKITGITAIVLTALGGLALAISGILVPFIAVRFAMSMLVIQFTSSIGLLGRFGGVLKGFFMLLRANPFFALATFLAGFVTYFITNWGRLKQLWTQGDWKGIGLFILQGLEAGLNMMTMGLYGTVKRIISGIISLVLDILGIHSPSRVFAQIGEFLMAGLVNGITSGLAAVKKAITGAGEATIGWFKEKLGIHSPSRVFAELGGFTMAGLHQGLVAGSDGPLGAVKAMAGKLTAAGAGIAIGAASTLAHAVPIDHRQPISASQPAQPAGGLHIGQIVIQASPGMDERKLAQLVRREIERLDRERQARGRGRLSDKD